MESKIDYFIAGALGALAFIGPAHAVGTSTPQGIALKAPAPAVVKTPAVAIERAAPTSRSLDSAEMPRQPVAPRTNPLEGRVVHTDEGDTSWAASARWKASFTANSTQFVPFFGSEKPHDAPLTFTTRSITVGGAPIALGADKIARDGDHISIERGVVDEAWNTTLAGIEQTFTIATRLGAGDVRVRVGFEGEYSAELDADGVLFTSDMGRVRYGKAIAIDAAGRRIDVAELLVENAIELVVPDSFLAHATYPVTIDPYVNSFFIQTTTAQTIDPDVAFENATGYYLYTYELVFSATDHDVFTIGGFDNGTGSEQPIIVDGSTVNWAYARVAINEPDMMFMVVAEVGAVGSREIRGRRVDPSGLYIEPSFTISDDSPGEKIHPVIGGNANFYNWDTQLCVVWERVFSSVDHDIHARLVAAQSFGTSGPVFSIDNTGATLDTNPSIAKCDGLAPAATQEWTIAWEREYNPNDHDIYAAQVHFDGTITHSAFTVDTSTYDDLDPSVSSILDGKNGPRPYLIAFARRMSATDRDVMLYGMRGDQILATMDLAVGQIDPDRDDFEPAVDCDGHMFGVAYTKEFSPGDNDVWLNWIYFDGNTLVRTGIPDRVAFSQSPEDHPAITAKHSGGRISNRFSIVHERLLGGDEDIHAAIWDAPTIYEPTMFCAGNVANCPCGNSGVLGLGGCSNSVNAMGGMLSANGNGFVADDHFVLSATGLPPVATCLFFQGTSTINGGSGAAFGDGLRCVSGTIVRLGVKVCSAGVATYPAVGDATVSERGNIPALGGQRYYQAWYRNAANYCTSATFNLTNGVQVLWVP